MILKQLVKFIFSGPISITTKIVISKTNSNNQANIRGTHNANSLGSNVSAIHILVANCKIAFSFQNFYLKISHGCGAAIVALLASF